MKSSLISMAVLALLSSACSFNKDLSYEDAYDGHPSEKSSSELEEEARKAEEEDLFSIEEETDETESDLFDEKVADEEENGLDMDEGEEDLLADEADDDVMIVEDAPVTNTATVINTASLENYEVQKGETLMMIAFKIYGDYGKWKELAEINSIDGASISSGSVIKYPKPEREFNWPPEGEAHLIISGETLGKISKDKYGRAKHWEYIWNNNRPMIKDPDKIFAGFTLFTLPLDEIKSRDVSSL